MIDDPVTSIMKQAGPSDRDALPGHGASRTARGNSDDGCDSEVSDRERCCSRWVELDYAVVPIGVDVNAGGSGIRRILRDGLQVAVR